MTACMGSMARDKNQSHLTLSPATDDISQTNRAWLASNLARYVRQHRLDLGMTVACAAELSGLALSEWSQRSPFDLSGIALGITAPCQSEFVNRRLELCVFASSVISTWTPAKP